MGGALVETIIDRQFFAKLRLISKEEVPHHSRVQRHES
jgi:hypothetical protein